MDIEICMTMTIWYLLCTLELSKETFGWFQKIHSQTSVFAKLLWFFFSSFLSKGWKEEYVKKWKPKCLEELLDLPCFLILSGEDRSGETLPRWVYHIGRYNVKFQIIQIFYQWNVFVRCEVFFGESFKFFLYRSLKYADFNIINQSKFHRSTIEEDIGMCYCYLMVNGGANHSSLSNRPAVMNNIRTSCGTTYLNPVKKGNQYFSIIQISL